MGLLGYTKKIEAEQSAEEIKSKLLSHYVIDLRCDLGDEMVFIEFSKCIGINTKGEPASYKITAKINPVFELLKKQQWSGEITIAISRSQAKRVAWRIVKRWIDTQLAFVETGMLRFDEVFL